MNRTTMSTTITPPLAELASIYLHKRTEQPLQTQLYRQLRERMLSGALPAGTRLPSSRALAKELAVGRNTVIAAYEQLQLEGYLQSHTGTGTFVAETLPESWHEVSTNRSICKQSVRLPPIARGYEQQSPWQDNWSTRHKNNRLAQPFLVGMPDIRAFPARSWNRLTQTLSINGQASMMGFGDPAGLPELREAIAHYLRSSRAVVCTADNILITTGAQQALGLCSFLLLNPGDSAAIEEPGYRGARYALLAHGAKLQTIAVDKDGMDVDALSQLKHKPRLVYCTPANQYPTGAQLPLARRQQLLDWAAGNEAWIIEDDYDSEYHYHKRPLASLQGLARHPNVIYMGSFSKVLYPGLRLGYLVVPDKLLSAFARAKMEQSGETTLQPQAVTAAFMREGHFGRHIKRMRLRYRNKLDLLQNEALSLSPWATMHPRDGGMHTILSLRPDLDEQVLRTALQEAGLQYSMLSDYFYGPATMHGLALGFANCSEDEIVRGVQQLRKIMVDCYGE